MKQLIAMLVASLFASAALAAPPTAPAPDPRLPEAGASNGGALTAEESQVEEVSSRPGAKGEKDKARAAARAGKKQGGTPPGEMESLPGSGPAMPR